MARGAALGDGAVAGPMNFEGGTGVRLRRGAVRRSTPSLARGRREDDTLKISRCASRQPPQSVAGAWVARSCQSEDERSLEGRRKG